MAWKKDLAKLKQELVKEEPPPGKVTPPPKPAVKHPVSKSIEEEDAIFLSAMGLAPAPARRAEPAAVAVPAAAAPAAPAVATPQIVAAPQAVAAPPAPAQAPPPPAPEAPATPETFEAAMSELKGMKPLGQRLASAPPRPPAPKPAPVPAPPAPPPPAPVLAPPPEAKAPAPPVETAPPGPVQIQLAAGMAIEVDGALDIKGHAKRDAEERLKERILDGSALGWRTLLVTFGASPELRAMVLELIAGPEAPLVARYAQAPVPMGGAQAWILYFRPQPFNT